jgi:hypothetical protein
MTQFKEYFEAVSNPTEEKISQALIAMNAQAMQQDQHIEGLIGDYNRTTDFKVMDIKMKVMEVEVKRMELCENRINKLLELRGKLQNDKLQKTKCMEGIVNEVVCGICNVKSIGLQIPNSPVIVCLNCIYSTVLEHSTKVDWVTQQNTMMNKTEK